MGTGVAAVVTEADCFSFCPEKGAAASGASGASLGSGPHAIEESSRHWGQFRTVSLGSAGVKVHTDACKGGGGGSNR